MEIDSVLQISQLRVRYFESSHLCHGWVVVSIGAVGAHFWGKFCSYMDPGRPKWTVKKSTQTSMDFYV